MPQPHKQRKDWAQFANLTSHTSTQGPAKNISPNELVDMAYYRSTERTTSGRDVLRALTAYAQDNMVFDDYGRPQPVDDAAYANTPRERKLNKFGKAYMDDAKLWLHKYMADVVVDAAIYMHKKYGWTSAIYDGLRTVNGAYNAYLNAEDSDLEQGLLSTPGLSAHNKGMAADMMMFDASGKLVNMGGNFDHLDMSTNGRACTDLPKEILDNRLKREIAFQRAALSRGRLFAPLRSEFWDERFPENDEDNWRVLDSLTRCTGVHMLSVEDDANRRSPKDSNGRKAFHEKWEKIDYQAFVKKWQELLDEQKLRAVLELPNNLQLPPDRSTIIYHGDYNPLYDRNLIASGKNITDNSLDTPLTKQA
jgi:D-alanyl-D-alanine dipeptidase